jgi:MFS family permease
MCEEGERRQMTVNTARGGVTIWATFRDSPLPVKTILAGVLVNRLGGFLSIFLALFLVSRGYSTAQAAIALGAYGGGATVGVFIGGALADRLGARNATVISMTSSSACIASLLFLHNYWLLLAAVALVNMVAQMYRPASATLLSDMIPESHQVMIFAMYRFGLNLGATAAPLVGFALYNLNHHQYQLLFWGEALIALAYAVVALVTLPAHKPRSTVSGPKTAPQPEGSYIAVIGDRRYRLYLIATFFHAAVYVQYLTTLPLDVNAAKLEIFWYTAAVSLNGFIVIAFELLLTKITQNWPYKVTIGATFALLGAGVAFYALPMGPAVIIVGTLIWSLGEIIGGPAVFAYPAVAGPAYLKGRYIGGFQFMFGLGSAIGPVVGGWLFIRLGHNVWPVMALGSLIATSCALAAVRPPATSSNAGDSSAAHIHTPAVLAQNAPS